jgi:hypothetical protein
MDAESGRLGGGFGRENPVGIDRPRMQGLLDGRGGAIRAVWLVAINSGLFCG